MKQGRFLNPRAPMDRNCVFCGECLPCPKGISIPDVLKIMDTEASGVTPSSERMKKYHALPVHASRCVACRQCESRCPYCVEVVSAMRRAWDVFGR